MWRHKGSICLDTWISDSSDPIELKTKKQLFRTFRSLGSWPIESRVIAGLFQLLRSLGSLVFHLFPNSISCAYNSRNSISMEFPRKDKWQKHETYNYVIQRTSGPCKQLPLLVTRWLDHFDHQSYLFGYQFLGSLGSIDHWSIFANK